MKTRKTIPLKFIGLLCFALNSSVILAQSIITIDNNSGSETTYQTLQDAHDNAVAGDTIYVQPSSVSYGSAILTKPITVVGRSHSEVGKQSITGTITIGTSNVSIKGIYVDGSITTTISSSETPNSPPFTDLKINDCYASGISIGNITNDAINYDINFFDVQIRGNYTTGVGVNLDASNIIFTNNIITDLIRVRNPSGVVFSDNIFRPTNFKFEIWNYDLLSSLTLANNMFIFNTSASNPWVQIWSGHVNFINNLTYNYNWSNVTYSPAGPSASYTESNTIANTDPLFTNVDPNTAGSFAGGDGYDPSIRLLDDMTLQPTSPVIDAGVGNSEIGLYKNYNYKNLGNPNGFPLLDVYNYDASVPKNGNMNVTIQAKAN